MTRLFAADHALKGFSPGPPFFPKSHALIPRIFLISFFFSFQGGPVFFFGFRRGDWVDFRFFSRYTFQCGTSFFSTIQIFPWDAVAPILFLASGDGLFLWGGWPFFSLTCVWWPFFGHGGFYVILFFHETSLEGVTSPIFLGTEGFSFSPHR